MVDAIPSWKIPNYARKQGQKLIHQQCWCWGCDIRRSEGNLLLQYGFQRERVTNGDTHISSYSMQVQATATLILWGFGFFYGKPGYGGIYMGRYVFTPQLLDVDTLPTSTIWKADQLPKTHRPRTREDIERLNQLAPDVMRWIGTYEQWVQTSVGASYRHRCLDNWKHTAFSAAQMAPTWFELAEVCANVTTFDDLNRSEELIDAG